MGKTQFTVVMNVAFDISNKAPLIKLLYDIVHLYDAWILVLDVTWRSFIWEEKTSRWQSDPPEVLHMGQP